MWIAFFPLNKLHCQKNLCSGLLSNMDDQKYEYVQTKNSERGQTLFHGTIVMSMHKKPTHLHLLPQNCPKYHRLTK